MLQVLSYPPVTVDASTLNAYAMLGTSGITNVRVQTVGGSGVTFALEESYDNTLTWRPSPFATKDTTQGPVTSMTGADNVSAVIIGATNFRIRVTSPGTGTVTVTYIKIQADNLSGFSSSGGAAGSVVVTAMPAITGIVGVSSLPAGDVLLYSGSAAMSVAGARRLVAIYNNSLSPQTVTYTIYDNATTNSGVVKWRVGMLGITQVINVGGLRGIRLANGLTVIASGAGTVDTVGFVYATD